MYTFVLDYFDLPILHAINGSCGQNWLADRLISHIALDFKFAVPLCILWVMWIRPAEDQLHRRRVLMITIVAVLLSVAVNRSISVLMPYRIRPMETSDIGYHPPLFEQGTVGAGLGIAVQLVLNRDHLRAAATPVLALEEAKPA